MSERVHTSFETPLLQSEIQPNANAWDQFYDGFTPMQRDQFHARVLSHFSRLIQEHLKKLRESAKKLKQSHN